MMHAAKRQKCCIEHKLWASFLTPRRLLAPPHPNPLPQGERGYIVRLI
jgi:hypothetical protein